MTRAIRSHSQDFRFVGTSAVESAAFAVLFPAFSWFFLDFSCNFHSIFIQFFPLWGSWLIVSNFPPLESPRHSPSRQSRQSSSSMNLKKLLILIAMSLSSFFLSRKRLLIVYSLRIRSFFRFISSSSYNNNSSHNNYSNGSSNGNGYNSNNGNNNNRSNLIPPRPPIGAVGGCAPESAETVSTAYPTSSSATSSSADGEDLSSYCYESL